MISPPQRHLHNFFEWDTVMCYATASLGALWLLGLAWMKTSVDRWVKEVTGSLTLVLSLVLVRYRALFGAREKTRLCMLGRLRGRRGHELIQSWFSCKQNGRCNGSNDSSFFSEDTKRAVWQGYLLNRFACTCGLA